METAEFTLDVAKKRLFEDGVLDLNDSRVGSRILDMEKRGFPYLTEYGMDFCKQYAFDKRIRSILESSLGECSLGHWLRYEEYTGHVECFRRGGPNAGRHVLALHMWAKGSQVEYYVFSHRHDLKTTQGRRSLHEISLSELERVGSQPKIMDFPDGGMVIIDARLGFQIRQGYAITFLFATNEVIAQWVKMALPYSKGLEDKVKDLEKLSDKIGTNFTFEGSVGSAVT